MGWIRSSPTSGSHLDAPSCAGVGVLFLRVPKEGAKRTLPKTQYSMYVPHRIAYLNGQVSQKEKALSILDLESALCQPGWRCVAGKVCSLAAL